MSNAGGAWDNTKKYIEGGAHGGKGSECHKVGDAIRSITSTRSCLIDECHTGR